MPMTTAKVSHRNLLCALLGLCGPLSAGAMVAADRIGAHLTPGYSSVTQAISELVATGAPRKDLLDPMLLAFHGLVIPFAVGLHLVLRPKGATTAAPIMLAGAGVAGVLLTLFFPCDPGCEPFVSLRGTLHIFIAVPMGIAILVSIFLFARAFARQPDWAGFPIYSTLTAGSGLLLAVATVLAAESDWVGVLERILTLSYIQWYGVVGSVMVLRAVRSSRLNR